jgi:hypothetical protein
MTMNGRHAIGRVVAGFLVLAALAGTARPADTPATGLRKEVKVAAPTRLDWRFAVADFGAGSDRLPDDYDSTRQRYLLYAPKDYDKEKAWPLVAFISPGDDPLGWRYWQKVCEDSKILFCAPYGAGNNCPVGKRARIVLDMLDDVRRHYRIDPDQTYLAGFSGGGRMACTIAFALPEYFGGVIPVCGTNPLNRLDYLRHRVQSRLSVAFVTGSSDFNRRENEDFMYPFFRDLGIRSKLWVVPKMGHAIPQATVLEEVQKWLADDLARRRKDAKVHPGLAVKPDEAPAGQRQAADLLRAAEAELKVADHTWRGVALLQGVVKRWDTTEAARKAKQRLEDLADDARLSKRLEAQKDKDERTLLLAQAKALTKFGDTGRALKAWKLLARKHADTSEGKKAEAEVKRLREKLAATPYLGVTMSRTGGVIAGVQEESPAAKAGLQQGDRLLQVGGVKVQSLGDLRLALASRKPGDKIKVELRRSGEDLTLTVTLGKTPEPSDE